MEFSSSGLELAVLKKWAEPGTMAHTSNLSPQEAKAEESGLQRANFSQENNNNKNNNKMLDLEAFKISYVQISPA